jgi:hypothetical protein
MRLMCAQCVMLCWIVVDKFSGGWKEREHYEGKRFVFVAPRSKRQTMSSWDCAFLKILFTSSVHVRVYNEKF